MKTLLLLRHAKSCWDDPELADIDRPLNRRGQRAAPMVGLEMRKRGYRPDQVLASPARRTRETWELLAPALQGKSGSEIPIAWREAIYAREAEGLAELIRQEAPVPAKCVLLLGHNPALEDLAMLLIGSGTPEALDALDEKFPTAALAVLDLPIESWAALQPGSARLEDFLVPRRLEG